METPKESEAAYVLIRTGEGILVPVEHVSTFLHSLRGSIPVSSRWNSEAKRTEYYVSVSDGVLNGRGGGMTLQLVSHGSFEIMKAIGRAEEGN